MSRKPLRVKIEQLHGLTFGVSKIARITYILSCPQWQLALSIVLFGSHRDVMSGRERLCTALDKVSENLQATRACGASRSSSSQGRQKAAL